MKKVCVCCVLLLVGTLGWSNIAAIDYQSLAKYETVKADMQYLYSNSDKFDHWSAKWTYADPKDACLNKLKALSLKVSGLRKQSPNEIDLSLLLLLTYQYRYNLDDNAIAKDFKELVIATEEQFKNDYRPLWFDAAFDAHSGSSKDSIDKFQSILANRQSLETVHPALLLDYGQACYIATMLRTAKITTEAYVKRTGTAKSEIAYAETLDGMLLYADPKSTYQPNEVWEASKDGSNVRVYSQLLSTSFSIPGDWKIRPDGYGNSQTICVLTPPLLTSKFGKKISINLVLIQSTKDKPLTDFIAELKTSMGGDYTVSKANLDLPESATRRVERVTNAKLYPERGGMAGYAMFFANPLTGTNGFNLDIPKSPLKGDSGLSYYKLNKQLDRFDATVTTILLVDSCQEVADETDAIVAEFLKTLRLD